jgi:hypothetical protein
VEKIPKVLRNTITSSPESKDVVQEGAVWPLQPIYDMIWSDR